MATSPRETARVQVLAPTSGAAAWSDFLRQAGGPAPPPFSAARLQTVDRLSEAFLADPELRRDPASVAVAYWMRRASLERLAEEFRRKRELAPSVVLVPVGRVLHIAPSNVDTLFVYSWALSFLCGNRNIVRVSQDRNPVIEAMLRAIETVARGDAELRDDNRFVTYAHDEGITGELSAWCSHRILWGGDDTVAALRPLPLSPHASERVFGSKFSYSVVAAEAYRGAPPELRERLAGHFFNDLFWFDQMACSSPHVIFWVGDEAAFAQAIPDFEDRLQAAVERKSYTPSASDAVHRLTHAFELAADHDLSVSLEHSGFVAIRERAPRWTDKQVCGGGLIRHARIDRLEDLERFAGEADQTLTHFGFERDALLALAARLGARGLDRIVPVGEALSFDVVWDGFDLLDDLVRRVRVQA